MSTEQLRNLWNRREQIRESLQRTHHGAPGRVNLDEIPKALREPMFPELDRTNREIKRVSTRLKIEALDSDA